ncbi:centrosomal protein of 170 kDa protein B-like isoform X2 [Acipenser ruthenus]|uniref:centrosomal protein of 170 kDa protein B-like isoform X2 n=1 Tax=Acipenser ruthenus TaxID=7906 RepID=UPI002742957B|nr:centrosomal protein of 170 kDa protein B-like isoform X2 [Acipenser ruthenus]
MSVTSWFLVSSSGTRHRLPREMIFVGREDCELMLQSRSVDKQHAVINYDLATDEHLVKDLGSLNGTFVNDLRIPDQTYMTLKLNDVIRFGYDTHVYVLERSQHRVPEEALKHEKYTSQLQMNIKVSDGKKVEQTDETESGAESPRAKLEKGDPKGLPETSTSRPTPLYGQPSWWGEDDAGNKVPPADGTRPEEIQSEGPKETARLDPEVNGTIADYRDSQGKSIYSYRREPSYFEIPTKEFQQHHKSPEAEVHEIPTKDTDAAPSPVPATTPPVVQSHASFTIEFDNCTPGKIKIRDHITKFSLRQRQFGKDLAAAPTEVMSVESKVADWLVHSDPSLMRRKPPCDDVYSTKSDLPVYIKTLQVNRHEDGTQSDSEDPILSEKPNKQTTPEEEPLHSPPESHSSLQSQTKLETQESLNQQAFVIEFFDDNPRKKRSQSFTHNSVNGDSYSALKAKLEKRKVAVATTQHTSGPVKSAAGPQRSSSLKREKTEDRLSSGSSLFSSRTPVTVKPFGSVGKKSKLAQDFAAEFLKAQSATALAVATPAPEKPIPQPVSAPPVMESAPPQLPTPPTSQPVTPFLTIGSLAAPLAFPLAVRSLDMKPGKLGRNEEDDSLSDAGTYTIETESQDKEVEEARNMIDQVFGVLESPEYTGVYRPVINDDKEEHNSCRHSKSNTVDQKETPLQGYNRAFISGPQIEGSGQARHVGPVPPGGPKWVSRWASLADSCGNSGPASGLHDLQQHGDVTDRDRRIGHLPLMSRSAEHTESDSTQSARTRRLLPQVPPAEKSESPTPSIVIRPDPYPNYEVPERGSGTPRQQESAQRLCVQDDLDPDSLSDASKSDDGSAVQKNKKHRTGRGVDKTKPEKLWTDNTNVQRLEEKPAVTGTRATSFYIGSEETPSKQTSGHGHTVSRAEREPEVSSKPATSTVFGKHLAKMDAKETGKQSVLVQKIHLQEKEAVPTKESSTSFVRQESFTKDRPSDDVPINKLPHISSHPALKDLDVRNAYGTDCSQDTQLFLKDTENALAALEAKFHSHGHHRSQKSETSITQMEDSLSGESDVDTASTVSHVSSKKTVGAVPQKRYINSLQKEKSSSTPSIQDQYGQTSARERLSEKRRTQVSEGGSKADSTKRFQLRRSTGNRGSLDFTEDVRSTSLQYWPDSFSSDHESSSRPTMRKKLIAQPQKEDPSKVPKSVVYQALTRSNSLSAPRPTRASMLRRARLGEASDNEGTETDRVSLNSDASGPSKPQADSKKLSRLDLLAMPRKRTGSFTTPSDTETSTPRSGFSTRSMEFSNSVRKSVAAEAKPTAKRTPGAGVKQPVSRGRSSSARYSSATSSSRRRQKGSDYISTSDEEYESNHTSPKHKRSHASTATQTSRAQAAGRRKVQARETEEEEEDEETDPYQHWSSHSAEIAKLSQDLAKDLAILAREIHDVAGDGDSQSSSGTGPSTSLSSVPNTPASTMSAREELVQHIPEASLNFQKVPPGSTGLKKELDQNMNDQDLKRRSWSREEVILDNLMLNPVSQLSQAIRENTEQLAEKMKILFQNRTGNWEDIEAKMYSENEVPILKTSNKEITSILKELRRVQKQLEVINTIIDPSGNPDLGSRVFSIGAPPASTRGRTGHSGSSPRDSRSPAQRGSYPSSNANTRGKREACAEEESYIV